MPFKRVTFLFLLALLAMPTASALADPLAETDVLPWSFMPVTPAVAPQSYVLQTNAAAPAEAFPVAATRLRKVLADFAVTLRDVRYRRGGDSPATGFDCSGFVRYVFQHSLGQKLPTDSASQYRAGRSVARDDLRIGDLVFFHVHGKRVSHVGIYLGHGRFIHSPSTGRTVSISSLDEGYWAKHFAGAKRPSVLS